MSDDEGSRSTPEPPPPADSRGEPVSSNATTAQPPARETKDVQFSEGLRKGIDVIEGAIPVGDGYRPSLDAPDQVTDTSGGQAMEASVDSTGGGSDTAAGDTAE